MGPRVGTARGRLPCSTLGKSRGVNVSAGLGALWGSALAHASGFMSRHTMAQLSCQKTAEMINPKVPRGRGVKGGPENSRAPKINPFIGFRV